MHHLYTKINLFFRSKIKKSVIFNKLHCGTINRFPGHCTKANITQNILA